MRICPLQLNKPRLAPQAREPSQYRLIDGPVIQIHHLLCKLRAHAGGPGVDPGEDLVVGVRPVDV